MELESKYASIWDKELNTIYKKLLMKLSGKEKKLLEESQKGWLKYHEAEVWNVFYLREDGEIFGTQGRVQMITAYKDRIRERTLQLIEYYYNLGGDVVFAYKEEKK